MAEGNALQRFRQQVDEAGNVVVVELSAPGELSQDWPELGSQGREALSEEIADPFSALAKA